MSTMPPLILLQTVETVVRCGSFKRAADELLVTPSAVSHRIKSVEQALAFPLFFRVGQGVEPSEHALLLAKAFGVARAELMRTWDEITASNNANGLRLCCMASFGDHFILPNIEAFRRKFPDVELEFTNIRHGDAPPTRSYDIIIGVGEKPGGGWKIDELMDLDVHLIASPGVAAGLAERRVLDVPLIGYGVGTNYWELIADEVGYELPANAKILTFDSMASACSAAEHGLGAAMAPTFLAQRMAREGRVVILGAPIKSGLKYWFAVNRDLQALPVVAKLRRWVGDLLQKEGA
jgi:DNA-binding transcriptional LysR family regulator